MIVSLVGYVKSTKEAENRFEQRAGYISEIASQSGTNLLWDFEYKKLALFSQYILEDPSVSGVLYITKAVGVVDQTHAVGFIRGSGPVDKDVNDITRLFPDYYDDVNKIQLTWDNQIIGDLHIFFDRRELYIDQNQKILGNLIWETMIFLFFFVAIYLVLQTQFIQPFKRSHLLAMELTDKFNHFIKHIGEGGSLEANRFTDFGELLERHSIHLDRKDEVGDFYRAFNALVSAITVILSELSQYSSQLNILNEELESRVKERTQELEATCIDLKNAQGRMVQQEKLASIGQLAAGVAHEINNPLGYISSNINRLEEYFNDLFEFIGELEKEITNHEIIEDGEHNQALTELKDKFDYDFIKQDLPELLKDCVEGSVRVQGIVENLKSFSRMDDAGTITEFDINDAINSTHKLVHNELKYNCDVEKDLQSTLKIWGHYGQINQVVSNLLVNASHAIKETEKFGTVSIKTWSDDSRVYLLVRDTGKGIQKEHVEKIFEPFFTTKAVGKGTGLGLNISYDIIVNNHKGEITVESEVGKGTTFMITLPISQPSMPSDIIQTGSDKS